MSLTTGLLCCAFFLLLLNACQKENDKSKVIFSAKGAENRTNLWLEQQKSPDNQANNDRIQLLKEKLDYSHLYFEDFRDNEHFIVVPIKDDFPTINNKGKKAINVLLLIENKFGYIRKGNIVQYISNKVIAVNKLPENSFFKIFNAETFSEDGQFSFLTINDRLDYEITYKDGLMISSGRPKALVSSTTLNGPPEDPIGPDCIDWYLVTTFYYEDGTTSQTEEFLYNTCGSSGSGGSGNNTEYEFEALRNVAWNVWSPNGTPASSGTGYGVNSLETIKGRRNSSEPQGGHFKSMYHVTSECNSCPQTTGVYMEDNCTVSAANQQASSSVEGHYHANGTGIWVPTYGSRSWQFQTLFP